MCVSVTPLRVAVAVKRKEKEKEKRTIPTCRVADQQIPDPLTDLNHARFLYSHVQTSYSALIPVTALHITGSRKESREEKGGEDQISADHL